MNLTIILEYAPHFRKTAGHTACPAAGILPLAGHLGIGRQQPAGRSGAVDVRSRAGFTDDRTTGRTPTQALLSDTSLLSGSQWEFPLQLRPLQFLLAGLAGEPLTPDVPHRRI